MKRILCIWLPQWPLQRLAAVQPAHEGRGTRVADAATVSKTLFQRSGLSSTSPNLQFDINNLQFAIPSSPDPADRESLLALAAWCCQFSPIVGLEDVPNPECLFLDITGLDHLFHGEAALGEQVIRALAGRGLAVRAAIADTLGAAWAAAHFLGKQYQMANRKSQIANIQSHAERGNESAAICNATFAICNLQFPLHIIPPNQTAAALAPLPIQALRLPPETVELLHSLGIDRIGPLERLPRKELDCRFGPQLLKRWDQALGRLAEPIPVEPFAPQFAARHEMEHPAANVETVSWVLGRLAQRIAEMLACRGRGAVRLECRLDCQAGAPVAFAVGFFQPTASPRHLSQLTAMHLERISLASPVTAVALDATLTGPLDHHQEELFADHPTRGSLRLLALLVDRLTGRLGRHSVLRPRLRPEAQPELAYQYDPLVWGAKPGERRQKPLAAESRGHRKNSRPPKAPGAVSRNEDLPPRPLRLFGQPVALAAISAVPEGPPFSFRWHGCEHRITRSWGPERIETGWWRGRSIARDYYRVELATGHRFWLFRNLDDGRWFLHGKFE